MYFILSDSSKLFALKIMRKLDKTNLMSELSREKKFCLRLSNADMSKEKNLDKTIPCGRRLTSYSLTFVNDAKVKF